MMSRNKLKIFITGSKGFVGTHIKNTLIKKYQLLTPSKKILNLNSTLQLKKFIDNNNPHIIIHLATSTKFKRKKLNEKKNQIKNTFSTTKNLIKNINSECKLIIFFGSIEEYGKAKCPFKEKQIVKPVSYYGKYKYRSYLYISSFLKKKGINFIWLRPSLIYGHGDNKERYLGYILNSIKKNKNFYITPGNQIRDYIHVDDICKVLSILLINYKRKYNCILNISAQNYIKIRSIPFMIERLIKRKINYVIKKTKKKEINLFNSNKKLLNLFPNLKFMSFEKGLIKTLKDYSIL
jgi:nucleoside-diphosphate-sugar epimerase